MPTAPDIRLRLIDARDLAEFRGVSMSTAYKQLKLLKRALHKKAHHLVTNTEAARYFGVSLEDFEAIVKG